MSWLGFKVVFLSYRRRESSDISGRLYDRLCRKFGKRRVIKDVNSIPLGVDFREFIEKVIPICNVFIVVIGPNWLAPSTAGQCLLDDPEDLVRLELHCALRYGIRVIPLLIGDAKIPERGSLPEGLRMLSNRHGMALRADPDFHRDVDRLIAQL
jgi:TIR domain